jgi:hypothetical protein
MGSDRKRTNMEMWQDACAELLKQQLAWEKLIKKHGPRGEQITDKIEKLEMMIPILEESKHIEEPLSVGAKTHLSSVYAFEKYHKWSASKDKGNKYTDKGKEAEEESITLISRLDKILYLKNDERMENNFLCGHPDVIVNDHEGIPAKIIDVKTPWDAETFFSNVGKPLSFQYYWQMQGYMALTETNTAEVNFCLVNTPESILNDEKYRLFKRMNPATDDNPDYVAAELELINNLTFDDMPLADRRLKFTVHRNNEDIERAYRQVEKCRLHLIEIEKLHLNGGNIEELVPLLQNEA